MDGCADVHETMRGTVHAVECARQDAKTGKFEKHESTSLAACKLSGDCPLVKLPYLLVPLSERAFLHLIAGNTTANLKHVRGELGQPLGLDGGDLLHFMATLRRLLDHRVNEPSGLTSIENRGRVDREL